MSEEKAWQHGYPLEELKAMEEAYYSDYNKWALSPFTAVKKNTIADLLHKGELKTRAAFAYAIRPVKARSPVKTHDHVLGHRLTGDMVITKIGLTKDFFDDATNPTDLIGTLQLPVDKTIWAEVPSEDEIVKSALTAAGYRYVTSKVMSTAEIIMIYVLERTTKCVFDPLPETEKVNIRLIDLDKDEKPAEVVELGPLTLIKPATQMDALVDGIAATLANLSIDFQVHYSNYNHKKTWSALSLRGFSPDVTFIEKPAEMNDKWWAKHTGETFDIQDTELMKQFPQVQKIMDMIPGTKERVRFMKLAHTEGALHRHTDLVDPDSGTRDGSIMRLHVPIITNPDVSFYSWKLNGEMDVVHMTKGSCWYLDTRKPHAAVNKGSTDRIHLVIDVWANEPLRKLMMKEEWTVSPVLEPHELPFDPYTNPNGKDPYDAD